MYIMNSTEGILTSPGWPGDYSDNLNCTTRLQPGIQGTLHVIIDDIEIEDKENGGCFDSLKVLSVWDCIVQFKFFIGISKQVLNRTDLIVEPIK